MTEREISTDVLSLQADILDHSSEFVELVYREAPAEYRGLLSSEKFCSELAQENTFNYGKLYAYAEFAVFRREFNKRFPDASAASCINAFSSLLLKNDISIHNLVEFVEGADDQGQLRLNSPG